jgi:hypothetical protein
MMIKVCMPPVPVVVPIRLMAFGDVTYYAIECCLAGCGMRLRIARAAIGSRQSRRLKDRRLMNWCAHLPRLGLSEMHPSAIVVRWSASDGRWAGGTHYCTATWTDAASTGVATTPTNKSAAATAAMTSSPRGGAERHRCDGD